MGLPQLYDLLARPTEGVGVTFFLGGVDCGLGVWAVNRVLHWTLVAVIVVPVILTLLLLVSLALPIDRPNAFACTNASLVTVDAEVALLNTTCALLP